jgi:regulatory protein
MSFQKPYKVSSMSEALKKLEKYCAYQERSHKQVFQKCRDYGLTEDEANQILIELISGNFLNEQRFAEAYVKGKFKTKSWGKQKIVQGLNTAGVSKKLIENTIKEIDPKVYKETLIHLANKKRSTLKTGTEFEKIIKIQRFLLSKGYKYEEISEALKLQN